MRFGPAAVQRITAARSPIHASGAPARLQAACATTSASAHRPARGPDRRIGTPNRTTADRARSDPPQPHARPATRSAAERAHDRETTALAVLAAAGLSDRLARAVLGRIAVRVAIAALVPAIAAAMLGSRSPWLAALALPFAVVARPRARSGWTAWAVGLVLAAIAALSSARARDLVDTSGGQAWPTFDLASAPLPAALPEYVAITGVPHTSVVLDEYDVAAGGLPDQSRPAAAVLVPLAAAADRSVATRALVVARVRPSDLAGLDSDEPVTLRGRTGSLPPELLATIVDLAGAGERPTSGVLLDTLELPTRRDAWTRIAIAGGLVLLAGVAYGFALRERGGAVTGERAA
jgi:hypothetical protein